MNNKKVRLRKLRALNMGIFNATEEAPAPAVDWRKVAETMYQYISTGGPINALAAYERALRAENPALADEASSAP